MHKPDLTNISRIWLLLVFIFIPSFFSVARAQTELNAVQQSLELHLKNSIKTSLSTFKAPSVGDAIDFQLKPVSLFAVENTSVTDLQPVWDNTALMFSYGKSTGLAPAISKYEYYKLKLDYAGINNLNLSVEGGIIKNQNAFSSAYPAFHVGMNASVSYSLNNILSIYAYGTYVSPVLNGNSAGTPSSPLWVHPVLLNSETGAGLRLEYKNIKSDFGLRTIYDTMNNNFKPVNTIGTKVKIGF